MFSFNQKSALNLYLNYQYMFFMTILPDALSKRKLLMYKYEDPNAVLPQKSSEVLEYLRANKNLLENISELSSNPVENLSKEDYLKLFAKTFKKLESKDTYDLELEDKLVIHILSDISGNHAGHNLHFFFLLRKHLPDKEYNVLVDQIKELSKGLANETIVQLFSEGAKDILFKNDKDLQKVLDTRFLGIKTLDDLLNTGKSFKQINDFYKGER